MQSVKPFCPRTGCSDYKKRSCIVFLLCYKHPILKGSSLLQSCWTKIFFCFFCSCSIQNYLPFVCIFFSFFFFSLYSFMCFAYREAGTEDLEHSFDPAGAASLYRRFQFTAVLLNEDFLFVWCCSYSAPQYNTTVKYLSFFYMLSFFSLDYIVL